MPNYLKNTWYVAAEPAEIEQGKICTRRILNEPVALFRTESGDVVALEDRCSRHFAALSAGKICGELLQCPYHGARFNKHGDCMVEDVKERGIEMKIWAKDDPSGPAIRQWIALSLGQDNYQGNVDFELNVKYAAPFSFLFAGDAKPARSPKSRVFRVRQLNLITPESDTSCHYFFNNATDFAPDLTEFADAVHAGFVFAFEQDRAVIAAQAQRVPDNGHNFNSMTRVCFAGDGLQNQGRQMVAKVVAEEQGVP